LTSTPDPAPKEVKIFCALALFAAVVAAVEEAAAVVAVVVARGVVVAEVVVVVAIRTFFSRLLFGANS
jgi:hypothetical protein